ncbi:MAG: DUF748 domain-containing protein [Pseudomonadota bacterium]
MTDAVPPAPPTASGQRQRWARRLVVTLGLLAALAAAAWWGVPALLTSQLPPRLGQLLGRPVGLSGAHFNPLQMTLALQGLRIGAATGTGTDAAPLLEIDKIALDLGLLQSLRHRAPVVEALAIDGLRARLTRTADGRYDIDDLVTRLSAPGDTPPSAEPARFALHNLSLRNAQLRFDDRPVARVHEVQALTLTLPFLSNLPSDVAIHTQPRLAFRLNGTPFDTGSDTLPFADTRTGDLRLSVADLDLAPWLPYLPASLPLRLQRGRLDTALQLQFAVPPQGRPTVVLKGRFGLREVAVSAPDGAPLAAWQALSLELLDVQPLARRVALGPLRIDGLALDVDRDAQGRLNLQRLQPAPAASTAAPAAAAAPAASTASGASASDADSGWQVDLAGLQLDNAQLRWRDHSLRPAAAYTLAGLSLQLQALRWPSPSPVPVALKATLHSGASDGPIAATVAIDGQADPQQATLKLALDAPDLATLSPYTATALRPRIAGKLALQAELRWAADPAALAISLDQATLQDLQLHDGTGRGALLLAGVKRLQAGGVVLDLLAYKLAVAKLQIDQPRLTVARRADGQIDLLPWLPAAVPAPAAPTRAAPAPLAPPPWQLSLQDLVLDGGRLAWTDAAAQPGSPPLRAELAGLKLRLQGFSWPASGNPRAALPRLQLSASLGPPAVPGTPPERGQIDWNGRFGLAPLQADGRLQLQRLPLHAFVAYAGDALPAALLHADASLALQLRARATPAGWQLASDGDLQLTELMLHTRPAPGDSAGSELLSWQSLALQGVSVVVAPAAKPRVEVRELALTDFFSRLIITEQGRFNLQDVAAAPPAPAASAPATAVPPVAAASAVPAPAADLPIDLVLGQTTLRNGRIDFSDRFIRPNYSARLTELNGSVGTIRSGTREMATISLRGRAADTALLDISGQLNPTAQPLALDIRAKATDLELAPLSPYAGKYAGYAIARGKLSMDVAYKIDADGKLEAKNQVILNQLTFGERVESPSATQLPVLLAVALLKDRNGVIDINLPVSGTLSDPQFSVGGIIWKVIVNLLTKALTAPFALLAGGGADDLSQVQFSPGTARITDSGRQALAKVAKALGERPSLMMTVTGAADTVSERDMAQRSLLDERLAAEARRERLRAAPAAGVGAPPASGASAPAPAPLSTTERAAALKRLYQQTPLPDRPRNIINQLKDIPPAEMEARLLAGIRVTDETMRELALQRGLAVRDALIAQGLSSERLFLAAPKLRLSGEGDAAWVPSVNLTLSAQ